MEQNKEKLVLPTGKDIFNQLKALRKASDTETETLHEWVFDSVLALKQELTSLFEKTEFKEDPEILSEKLLKFHYLNAGLMGLVEGLYEKRLFIAMKSIDPNTTDEDGKVRKLTQADRELDAKAQVSDLKGLKKDLEETQRNLWERIQQAKGGRRY